MDTSLWPSLLNVGGALVVVVLLAVVLLRFAAPWLRRLQTPGGSQISVLEVKALDRQHRVALLRVREEDFLVALGAGSPCLLRCWPAGDRDPKEPEALASGTAETSRSATSRRESSD